MLGSRSWTGIAAAELPLDTCLHGLLPLADPGQEAVRSGRAPVETSAGPAAPLVFFRGGYAWPAS